ncbi:MAG: PadR family transcriptional regulator [Nitrosomonas sp.]|uniref:PadR family transcriptional regulator n=1 Tax=Nitrosomonas sp. TaxID=42353 RepID=UPI002723ACAA|nr:PadR family transcriptional regulator [Nitrosomonas sp.]MDO8993159.1 PadR family transcriptional regulator [Daejeonella sp.]MDP3279728.1 PadR family transcriptional regulator [Nitrosomonas sp.]MDP3664743.1 PadR family transcriptional regulator [Nitrosomonas sp.]MDZ4105204.1 PadR family transcriptional regulator [Nitrosomonas sp.]
MQKKTYYQLVFLARKFYLLNLLRKVNDCTFLIKKGNEEAMNVIFRKNFQIILLDILDSVNVEKGKAGVSAAELQSIINETGQSKKASLGTIVMSLARLAEKGLISFDTEISSRRRYSITLAGKTALRDYLNSFRSYHLKKKTEAFDHDLPDLAAVTK